MARKSNNEEPHVSYGPICNVEAERALLGCAILNRGASQWVSATVPCEAYHYPAHKLVAKHISRLESEGIPCELLTLRNSLQDQVLELGDELGEAGGEDYLIQIAEAVPSAANYRHYGAIVLEKYGRRQAVDKMQKAIKEAHSDVPYDDFTTSLFDIPRGLQGIGTDTFAADAGWDAGVDGRYIASGYPTFDAKTGGGYPVGEPTMVGAPRGGGKTAWLTDSSLSMARNDIRVGYATFEMPHIAIKQRMVQNLCGWSKRPDIMGPVQSHYDHSVEIVKNSGIVFYDPSQRRGGDRTIESLVAWATDVSSSLGLDILMVDYAQKMVSHKYAENRTRELDYVADELEWLAKRLSIPVVYGSQLSKNEDGGLKAKDCIRFEDNAAIVAILKKEYGKANGTVTLTKSRHEAESSWKCLWNGRFAKWEEEASETLDL